MTTMAHASSRSSTRLYLLPRTADRRLKGQITKCRREDYVRNGTARTMGVGGLYFLWFSPVGRLRLWWYLMETAILRCPGTPNRGTLPLNDPEGFFGVLFLFRMNRRPLTDLAVSSHVQYLEVHQQGAGFWAVRAWQ